MKIGAQKRLAADVMGCSKKRVTFDTERLDEIKEAITKYDIKGLIKDKAITKKPIKSNSRAKARKRQLQKKKGRRKGLGSRKGKKTARTPKKKRWMAAVRLQRDFLKTLRDKNKITKKIYGNLYAKVKGGFFRSKNHLKLYLEEYNLIGKNEK